MNSLFCIYETNMSLANILKETTGYEIRKRKHDSKYLCRKCTKVVYDFLIFKRTFEQATTYFKTLKTSLHNNKAFMVRKGEQYNNFANASDDKSSIGKNTPKIDTYNPSNVGISRKIIYSINDVKHSNNKQTLKLEHEETKKINCSLCDEKFTTHSLLQRHQRKIHMKEATKKQKKLHQNSSIQGPKVLIKSDTKELCKICKLLFTVEEYHLHLETHKVHVCHMCGHKFIRKTDLNDHEETHSNVCKYVCQHCGKAFKLRTALNKHRRIHTNPREEICDVCGQRFNTRDTLKTHYKLKHIKSKDFQCYLCGLAFTLKSTLEKHIERHNPNRKRIFSCKLCDISYINKYNLSRHYVVKHTPFENKPTCEFCGKGYSKKIDLVKHLIKHHEKHNKP